MVEKLHNNEVCGKCGAGVRLNALFCHNCGSQVAPDEVVEAENEREKKLSSAWFKDSIIGAESPNETKSEPAKIEKPNFSPDNKAVGVSEETKSEAKVIEKEAIKTELKSAEKADLSKLKTAASMRQRSKLGQKKTVEVVWESHENAPNGWFLFVALIFILFAAGMLAAMLYFR